MIAAILSVLLFGCLTALAGGDDPAQLATAGGGSTAEAVAFYLLAAAAALSALGCAIATNIVRMAICLLGTLASVAILYFLMAADFLGVIQLVVYAGGTLIVIVFGVMLTSRVYGLRLRPRPVEVLAGLVVCAGLFAGLAAILLRTTWTSNALEPASYPVAEIGQSLLSTYLVPFELVSVLLLAVMIGAAYLAQPAAAKKSSE